MAGFCAATNLLEEGDAEGDAPKPEGDGGRGPEGGEGEGEGRASRGGLIGLLSSPSAVPFAGNKVGGLEEAVAVGACGRPVLGDNIELDIRDVPARTSRCG